MNIDEGQRLITAPTAMFIKALDMLLDKMDKQGFDFGKVVALAGDTQVQLMRTVLKPFRNL